MSDNLKKEGKTNNIHYYSKGQEQKVRDPYCNPENKEKKQTMQFQSIKLNRQPGKIVMKNGMSQGERARQYEKKCEESKYWPEQAKRAPKFIRDKEKRTETEKLEQKFENIKLESKYEVKDMVELSKNMTQQAQSRLERIRATRPQVAGAAANKNIQPEKQEIKPNKVQFKKVDKMIEGKEEKLEKLPCSFCSVIMTLEEMDEHHKKCEMAFQCKKCFDYFPIFLSEEHIMQCKANKRKANGNGPKKYKQQKFFRPNQYEINERASEMLKQFPEMGEEQIMNIILDDIDEQETEAKRRGIPIEDSKYVPESLLEPQDDVDNDANDYMYGENMQDLENEENFYVQPSNFREKPKGKGLSQKQIKRLVTDTYKRGEDESEIDCAICSKQKQNGDKVIRLPCFHTYHEDCLIPWVEMKSVCPTCKHDLRAE